MEVCYWEGCLLVIDPVTVTDPLGFASGIANLSRPETEIVLGVEFLWLLAFDPDVGVENPV